MQLIPCSPGPFWGVQLHAPFLPSCQLLPRAQDGHPWMVPWTIPAACRGECREERAESVVSPFPFQHMDSLSVRSSTALRHTAAPGMFLCPNIVGRTDPAWSPNQISALQHLSDSAELLVSGGEYFQPCHQGFCALGFYSEQGFYHWCAQQGVLRLHELHLGVLSVSSSDSHCPKNRGLSWPEC